MLPTPSRLTDNELQSTIDRWTSRHVDSLTMRLTTKGAEWSGTSKHKENGLISAFKGSRNASIDLDHQWAQAV